MVTIEQTKDHVLFFLKAQFDKKNLFGGGMLDRVLNDNSGLEYMSQSAIEFDARFSIRDDKFVGEALRDLLENKFIDSKEFQFEDRLIKMDTELISGVEIRYLISPKGISRIEQQKSFQFEKTENDKILKWEKRKKRFDANGGIFIAIVVAIVVIATFFGLNAYNHNNGQSTNKKDTLNYHQ